MKKKLYTEFNDYCDYEQFDKPISKSNDMNEMLEVMRRMESTLQIIAGVVFGIFTHLIIKWFIT